MGFIPLVFLIILSIISLNGTILMDDDVEANLETNFEKIVSDKEFSTCDKIICSKTEIINDDLDVNLKTGLEELEKNLGDISTGLKSQNDTSFWLVLFSIFAVLAASGSAFYTGYVSRKQLNHSREQLRQSTREHHLRLRPRITFEDPIPAFIVYSDNTNMDYPKSYSEIISNKDNPIVEITFSVDVVNIGGTPTRNAVFHIIESPKPFLKEELINSNLKTKPLPIIPGAQVPIKFIIPIEYWNLPRSYYFGLYIEYEVDGKMNGFTGKMWKIIGGGTSTEESFMDTLDDTFNT